MDSDEQVVVWGDVDRFEISKIIKLLEYRNEITLVPVMSRNFVFLFLYRPVWRWILSQVR
jgi:hypothetical protein